MIPTLILHRTLYKYGWLFLQMYQEWSLGGLGWHSNGILDSHPLFHPSQSLLQMPMALPSNVPCHFPGPGPITSCPNDWGKKSLYLGPNPFLLSSTPLTLQQNQPIKMQIGKCHPCSKSPKRFPTALWPLFPYLLTLSLGLLGSCCVTTVLSPQDFRQAPPQAPHACCSVLSLDAPFTGGKL